MKNSVKDIRYRRPLLILMFGVVHKFTRLLLTARGSLSSRPFRMIMAFTLVPVRRRRRVCLGLSTRRRLTLRSGVTFVMMASPQVIVRSVRVMRRPLRTYLLGVIVDVVKGLIMTYSRYLIVIRSRRVRFLVVLLSGMIRVVRTPLIYRFVRSEVRPLPRDILRAFIGYGRWSFLLKRRR